MSEERQPRSGRPGGLSRLWGAIRSKFARRSLLPSVAPELLGDTPATPRRIAAPSPGQQGDAEARRLLDELDRRIRELPPDDKRAVEFLWVAAAELARVGRVEHALLLWSTVRRSSDRHCAAVVPIATAAATELAEDGADMPESPRRCGGWSCWRRSMQPRKTGPCRKA